MPTPIWSVTSAPAAEPLTRTEMKNYLKVPSTVTADDDLIDSLILEARQFVERMTARALITQTITQYWDNWPDGKNNSDPRVILPHVAPLQSVISLSYIASGDTPASYTTWASTNYTVDNISGLTGSGPARIVKNPGVSWPDLAEYYNAVKLVHLVGYGASASAVPAPLLTAMRRLVGAWCYGRKGSFKDDAEMIQDLINPYKVHK